MASNPPDILVELGHFLEEIEKRLPYGRLLSGMLLALAVLAGGLFLGRYVVVEGLWPLTQLILSGAARFPRPPLSQAVAPWIVLIVLFVGSVAIARQFNRRVSAQFRNLEETIGRYEEIVWLPPSREEKQDIAERLRKLGTHSVYFAHTGQPDCYELAAEFSEIFKRAGWGVAPIRPDADPKAHGTRSIEVSGSDKNLELVRGVSDALLGATRRAMSTASALYAGHTDITVKIGPRKMRSGEFL